MKKLTQAARMMKYMSKGKTLTPTYAKTVFGISKPSARICEMRDDGVAIVSTKNRSGNFAWKLNQA